MASYVSDGSRFSSQDLDSNGRKRLDEDVAASNLEEIIDGLRSNRTESEWRPSVMVLPSGGFVPQGIVGSRAPLQLKRK